VQISERDIERLFNIFDRNRSGTIDYDEFLRGVRVSYILYFNFLGRYE
jgi:Ca2+-binding EF-hand superfamily protein